MGALGFAPWALLPLAAAAAAAVVAYRAFRRAPLPGAAALGVSLGLAAAWNALHTLELLATSLPSKLFWLRGQHLVAFPLGIAWLAFALDYTGRRRALSRAPFRLTLLFPLVAWVLTLVDGRYRLILTSATLHAGGGALDAERGPAFWVLWSVEYALLLAAVTLLLRFLQELHRRQRTQVAALFAGVALPWVANVLFVSEVVERVNPTPIAFALSSLVTAWAFRRGGLLDLVPVARDRIVEEMRDGVVVLDGAGHVVDVNAAACRAFAWRVDAPPIGRSAESLFSPWAGLLAALRAAGEGEADVERDGRSFQVRVTPLGGSGGAPGKVLVWRDVTEHRRVEAQREALLRELARDRDRRDALIAASRDGIALVGRHGALRVLNQAALTLLGVQGTPSEWIDRPLAELLPLLRESDPQVVAEAVGEQRRVLGGDESPAEGEFATSRFVVHWQSLPVGSAGSSRSRLIVLRDVTAERRSAELRDDLTRSLVHDLRNPLASLAVSMALLLEELPEERREIPRIALRSARRMETMVESILDVARLEGGTAPLRRGPVPPASLVAEALERVRLLANTRGMRLEACVAPGLPEVSVDAELVGRILQNLLGNAIKFAGEGRRVRVEARSSSRDQRFVELSVTDDGPGVPAEIRGRLFEKFSRGSQEQRGTGLGLAFCRLAVEAHGGSIWASEARGASFHFTLPAVGAEAREPRQAVSALG